MLLGHNCYLGFSQPVKVSLLNDSNIKIFSDFQKLKEFTPKTFMERKNNTSTGIKFNPEGKREMQEALANKEISKTWGNLNEC